MKNGRHLFLCALIAVFILAVSACTPPPPSSNTNQANRNADGQRNSNTLANGNTSRGEVKTPPPAPGTANIEITSTPSGAAIILVPLGEDNAASPPQSYGPTPRTVNVPVGKYQVNLEMSGYSYFQREVAVKDGETKKVTAALKKR